MPLQLSMHGDSNSVRWKPGSGVKSNALIKLLIQYPYTVTCWGWHPYKWINDCYQVARDTTSVTN